MKDNQNSTIISWLFGIIVLAIGVLNIILIDPRPGIIYILLSALYFIPAKFIAKSKMGLMILKIFKIILGVIIIWFTLGISDLGDMFV